MSSVSELIKKIAGGKQPCLNGEVKSVDRQEMTCEVGFGDEDSVVASLVVGDKKRGIVQIPKVGSNVLVVFQELSVGFVLIVDEVEEILINGGENGGLVKIVSLVDKVNKIEADINSLKSVFVNWITAPSDGGAALKALSANWSGQSIVETKVEDLEDKTIKH